MHDNSLKNPRPWQQGETGNPNGRPTARGRLTERFIGDVSSTWERHGTVILEKMAVKSPDRFADLCSRLIPAMSRLPLNSVARTTRATAAGATAAAANAARRDTAPTGLRTTARSRRACRRAGALAPPESSPSGGGGPHPASAAGCSSGPATILASLAASHGVCGPVDAGGLS
jgi:hypothetical protein